MHMHAHHHGHDHGHSHQNNEKRTLWAVLLTASFMVIEVFGGIISGSLALLSDAVHMLTDASSLLLAWFAFRLGRKPSDPKRSFGYHRLEIVAAFANGITMFVVVGWIAFESVHRLLEPQPIMSKTMLVVAIGGFIINLLVFKILHGADRDNINIKGAIIHVIGDLLGSAAAIIAAIIIMFTGWTAADPILSLLMSSLILRSAWQLVKNAGHILLEGAPDWIEVQKLSTGLHEEIDDVLGVHHVHIWSLSSDTQLMTLHVSVKEGADHQAILWASKAYLKKHYGISHTTVQIEVGDDCPDEEDPDQHYMKGYQACMKPIEKA